MLQAFAEGETDGRALAETLGLPFGLVQSHEFPDGEVLATVPGAADCVIVYRSLDRPNLKLIELALAAEAWRRLGAKRLVLVAPYLAYMRQDTSFQPGQAISQRAVGALISRLFDRLVTVNPHLHRTRALAEVFAIPAVSLSAGATLGAWLAAQAPQGAILAGPDEESSPLVQEAATAFGSDWTTFVKHRSGDREVSFSLPAPERLTGRPVVIVDDICSSGATLAGAVERVRACGAADVWVLVVHALFDAAAEALIRDAGASRIVSTSSVPHPTSGIPLTPLLASALAQEGNT
jgi:ribose-phosphate pyrophosphokinase